MNGGRCVRSGALSLVVSIGLAGGACGPIGYISGVTYGASSAVDKAKAAGADTKSPYWWTRATLYLRQARIEAADADFEAANHFGRLSEEAARAAEAQAIADNAPTAPLAPAIETGGTP